VGALYLPGNAENARDGFGLEHDAAHRSEARGFLAQ
jgi:hypothetical protein